MTSAYSGIAQSVRSTRSRISALLLCAIAGMCLIILGDWPEIFVSTDSANNPLSIASLTHSAVHLADDVMISLRAGYIFNETGVPAYNRIDIAQPSTSYLAPYLYGMLASTLPSSLAVLVYSALGFFSVMLTFYFFCHYAKSRINAFVVVGLVCLTSTGLRFALNGWDHLFQAPCLVLAVFLSIKKSTSGVQLASIAMLLALGSLFRPDGIVIAGGIILTHYLRNRNFFASAISIALPFSMLLLSFLILNYYQFGHFTPTTARLKFGSSPSLDYAFSYILQNAVFTYSAITLLALLSGISIVYRHLLIERSDLPIIASCFATAGVALFNSDVFPGARMVWVPLCVTLSVILFNAPSILKLDLPRLRGAVTISLPYKYAFSNSQAFSTSALRTVLFMLFVLMVFANFSSLIKQKFSNAIIQSNEIAVNRESQLYYLSQWIDKNLDPQDGAIGHFYLGIAFHLPRFEAADFLGKADEAIATSLVKWGPPGHNKWNFEATYRKWNPQAILPPSGGDYSSPGAEADARNRLLNKSDFAFGAELIVSPVLRQNYLFCNVNLTNEKRGGPNLGLLLRKDIAERMSDSIACVM